MTEQVVIERTVRRLGRDGCVEKAARIASAFHNHAQFFGASLPDVLASHVAELELACEQLRVIAGSGLVDLYKVEALSQLQQRLR